MEYRLISITTNDFRFNNKFKSDVQYKLKPNFGKTIKKISENVFDLHLMFSLHDIDDYIVPYDIDLEIIGRFEVKDENKEYINDFINVNAVSILFPYLRTVLSTTMSSMMISPIVLPIVDVKQLFKNK